MADSQNNQQYNYLLPSLKSDSDIRSSDKPGQWESQESKAFADVANSLDYQAPGAVKSISSVPTMWARPLLMEMALYNQAHPIRKQVVEQWQGMLAAIALAEVRGFPLKAQLLELEDLAYEEFVGSLCQLFPDPATALYELKGGRSNNPWRDIYIWFWNGNPVGITSPSTLVVPSEEGDWGDLTWWREQDGIKQLRSPKDYLSPTEQALLWHWLANLRQELAKHNGKRAAINIMQGLIGDFQATLTQSPEQTLNLTDEPQFFSVPINRGVLAALNFPVKAKEAASGVRLIASQNKQKRPLLILDRDIANQWNIALQNIWVHGGKNLASLKVQDLPTLKPKWQNVDIIESRELFLDEFFFIDLEEALPGGLLAESTEPIAFNGQRITPLIPINPILLDYFTPEDLKKKIKFQPFNSGNDSMVKVILDLPLSGTREDGTPQNFRIDKDYPLKEENSLTQLPVLEVWPNFRAEGWQEYYGFYYDGEHGDDTFQVELYEAKESKPFKDKRGSFQLARIEEFPSGVLCYGGRQKKLIGLILLPTPEKIELQNSWKVGIDFGTSFTNIYINKDDYAEPLPIENLLLKITDVVQEIRLRVLIEYFIPEDFIPKKKPLPLSTVLTTRCSKKEEINETRPIFDGRIYIPDSSTFKPQNDWINTNLKWEPTKYKFNQLFLRHLALHITALATKNGIAEIQWSLSYPSAFSKRDGTNYRKNWEKLTKELENKTGIRQISPNDPKNEEYLRSHFRTESLATAQYFKDQEGHKLVKTTCIDIGGGTSDISIWEENKLLHQCSVQLAGRDLFSQFLSLNQKFFTNRFGVNISDWEKLKGVAFNAKLDVWLRLEGEKWLKDKKYLVEEAEDFQGFTRLTAIGIAGLYYYVGILLKVLYRENTYTRQEITEVYLGGNGSRLLNWLAEAGEFESDSEVNELLSRMLSKGSEFEDTEVTTKLSENPKHEVACGLVLSETPIEGKSRKDKDPLIAGESCQIDDEYIDAQSRLDLERLALEEKDIKEFKILEPTNIAKFLYEFNRALKELKIDIITRLPDYELSPELDKNSKLWGEVKDEITNFLLQQKGKNSETIRLEPPFIIGLKALLNVLSKKWAEK